MRTLALLLRKSANSFLLNGRYQQVFAISSCKNQTQAWESAVEPFSCLHADVINCNVTITSFETATKLPYEKLQININTESDADIYDVKQTEKDVFVSNTLKSSSIMDQMNILLPPMTDLKLNLEGKSSVNVLSGLECDNITISAEVGSVNLNQVKAAKVILNSTHGDVNIAKPVHGAVEISTCNKGCIRTSRIQGPTVELCSEEGCVSSNDLYSEELIVKSDSGDINIKSTHGRCDIDSESGNVFVGTIDGDLNVTATEGDIDAYITKPQWVYLHTNKGQINLYSNSGVHAQMHVEAESYEIDEDLKPQRVMTLDCEYAKKCRAEIGDGEQAAEYGMVYLHAPCGKFKFTNMSWFERIKSINSI